MFMHLGKIDSKSVKMIDGKLCIKVSTDVFHRWYECSNNQICYFFINCNNMSINTMKIQMLGKQGGFKYSNTLFTVLCTASSCQ